MFGKTFSFSPSIKYKYLLSTLFLVLLFTLITTYLWYSKTTSNAALSVTNYVSEMLRVSNDNFEIILKESEALITSVSINENIVRSTLSKSPSDYSSDAQLADDNNKFDDYIRGLFVYKHYINGIIVSDLNGRSFVRGYPATFNQIQSHAWYKSIINKESNTVFIPPHYNNGTSPTASNVGYTDSIMSFARPITNGYSTVLGFAMIDIKCSIIQDIFDLNLKNSGTVLIMDSNNGKLIFNNNSDKFSSFLNANELKSIHNRLNPSKGSFTIKIGNKTFLIVYAYSSSTKWNIVGIIPMDKLLADFYTTRNTVIYLSVIFCLIAVILTFFISSMLTRNILKLNKAVKKINKENLDISVNIQTNDEIGQLCRQINLMVLRIKELIGVIKTSEREKRKLEMKALQSQINPHFLYNTLNTIKFLANIQGVENIKKVSEALSTLLHINMEERSFITIKEEINYIESYIIIQKYKYSNKFETNFFVNDDVKGYMVLKLLLQPLVENSLMHGIVPLKGQGIINIKIYRENNCLILRVQDNGVGMKKEIITQIMDRKVRTDSIGLSNVISRVKINFGEGYGVSISSEPNIYTIIEISVPIITADKVEKYV